MQGNEEGGDGGGRQHLERLGEMLRRARQGRYTVEQLGAKANVSSSLISQIERGLGNPSFRTLMKLAQALDLPMPALFGAMGEGAGEADGERLIVRRDRRRQLVLPHEGRSFELLTPDLTSGFVMFLTTLGAGYENSERPSIHPGQEVIHVQEGALEVVYGESTLSLEAGDTMSYDSGVPHWLRNPNSTPADILVVATSSPF
jgi:transcriptional regulator with XRE-family HTH domain